MDVPISNVYPSSSTASSATASFRVYYTAPSGSIDEEDDEDEEGASSKGVVFVCVHGAGYSGLSYACVAKSLVEQGKGKVGVLSFDARGHGESVLSALL